MRTHRGFLSGSVVKPKSLRSSQCCFSKKTMEQLFPFLGKDVPTWGILPGVRSMCTLKKVDAPKVLILCTLDILTVETR